ncbi:alpha/beta fold hydrolase [Methanobrevibacter sp.]|uniref:alpha/beta fold hydrolase n=1 Tax=Methanobrevibacter sp. TaxID=66852 RepID=UPI0038904C1D
MSYLTMSDDVNIYYEDFGEGETLIFCHGLNSSLTVNEEFYNEFKDDFRIILYD